VYLLIRVVGKGGVATMNVQDFSGLDIACYRLVLRAEHNCSLPVFLGSTLRGAFGHALKQAVCVMPHKDCERCMVQDRCLYPYLFETPAPKGAGMLEGQQHAPHPFILTPPLPSPSWGHTHSACSDSSQGMDHSASPQLQPSLDLAPAIVGAEDAAALAPAGVGMEGGMPGVRRPAGVSANGGAGDARETRAVPGAVPAGELRGRDGTRAEELRAGLRAGVLGGAGLEGGEARRMRALPGAAPRVRRSAGVSVDGGAGDARETRAVPGGPAGELCGRAEMRAGDTRVGFRVGAGGMEGAGLEAGGAGRMPAAPGRVPGGPGWAGVRGARGEEGRTVLEAGDTIQFELTLIGRAIDYLPYIVFAVTEMARRGLGVARNRFELDQVTMLSPDGAEQPIYSGQTQKLSTVSNSRVNLADALRIRLAQLPPFSSPTFPASSPFAVSPPFPVPRSALRVCFLSPTRIRIDGAPQSAPRFDLLIRSLLRRISMLVSTHGAGEFAVDYKGLIQRAGEVGIRSSNLRWWDFERYSNRQQRKMKMGGFVGEIEYEGDPEIFSEFLPLLLVGEILHIGSSTTFGLGLYKICGLTPSDTGNQGDIDD
jgi:hypothetical protein